MEIITEIKNIKERVKEWLALYPKLRDNDNKLIANIWYNQMKNKKATAADLLQALSDGKLIKPESIRRCRQKVQEQNPHLRGTKYKAKQEQGNEFRDEIKDV